MSSPEKEKPLSETLSEACPDKEKHAEFIEKPCPMCGHINARPGSSEYMKAMYKGLREQKEEEKNSDSKEGGEATE